MLYFMMLIRQCRPVYGFYLARSTNQRNQRQRCRNSLLIAPEYRLRQTVSR